MKTNQGDVHLEVYSFLFTSFTTYFGRGFEIHQGLIDTRNCSVLPKYLLSESFASSMNEEDMSTFGCGCFVVCIAGKLNTGISKLTDRI